MRQATLPWAARPAASLASTSEHHQKEAFDPYYQHPPPPPPTHGYSHDAASAPALDPALLDVDTPTPSQAAPQQLGPALFSSSQDEQPPQQHVIDTALHPFFQPGGSSSALLPNDDASDDGQHKRPSRSSRAKAPISYREDLKAVLRADAAQESARLQVAKREAKAAKKSQRSAKRKAAEINGRQEVQESGERVGFEVVESRSAKKAKEAGLEAIVIGEASSSNAQAAVKKAVEQKPLSLAVKGTAGGTSASAHPFFTNKVKAAPAAEQLRSSAFDGTPASSSLFSAPRISSSKAKKAMHAPWPTLEDTHVTGFDTFESDLLSRAHSSMESFRSRWNTQRSSSSKPASTIETAPPQNLIVNLNHSRPQPRQSSISLTSIQGAKFDTMDDYLASCVNLSSLPPALSSATNLPSTHTETQMWTDAFRPHTSTSVLGNECNASYLLDWLRRLLVAAPNSVQTKDRKRAKRKGVQRRVDKTKRKRSKGYSDDESDLGDFIVDDHDDDDEEDAISEWDPDVFGKFGVIQRSSNLTDDEGDAVSLAPTSQSSMARAATKEEPWLENRYASLEKLSNCIILTGAPGTTKTASIYACASQLGYEVFELYPGMGKRSGKELLAAVGDLGRNHMVSSGGVGGGASFRPNANANANGTPTSTTANATAVGERGVRQSLILIEEADILLEEDKGFWPAIVELVAESKRPVVITCNDIELVPVHELPVQEVLEFRLPTLGEIVSWLQLIAARMGRYLSSDSVREMLRALPGTETALAGEMGDGEGLAVDIRQAINQVQFGHFSSPLDEDVDAVHLFATAKTPRGANLKALASATESASIADILETHLHGSHMEAYGDAGLEHSSSSSRQWGSYTPLIPQPHASEHSTQQSLYAVHREYGSTLAQMHTSLASLAPPCHLAQSGRAKMERMDRAKQDQRSRLREMLKAIFKHLPCSSMLSSAHIVEYAPMVRLMALVDDDLGQMHASLHNQAAPDASHATKTVSGRTTRNSSRLT
ncbi:hypothetical protein NDA11_003676 [Ustilago hordei]|nr:hypothetical protein NDA15_007226 [Ustilago hordei]KAJ1595592.1 hypothetical protein NDA11_003676 [Ustilago hordei]KAJ1603699.1 hypothetical protein NDA14_004616 [Ustilago hordei]KAJ1603896.1 hypothetical protein NDA14_006214 [Ustilago hordei]UTT88310.1 hypothetical protein NDA17_006738 [Ustilago hordei]